MGKELKEWINKSLNETIADEEARALEERLLRDCSARDQYLNAVNVHASLCRRFSAGAESSASTYVETFSRFEPAGVFPRARCCSRIGVHCGCCRHYCCRLNRLRWLLRSSVRMVGKGGVHHWRKSRVRAFGSFRGLLRLDFLNGALVTVEGPAEMEVSDGMHVVLHRGGHCDDPGVGGRFRG